MTQIETSLENFGYARVLVLTKAEVGASVQPSSKIEETFLSQVPEGAGASITKNGKDKAYHYFPRLGLYVGYMNKEGVKEAEKVASAIHGEEFISPIRPVAKRLAMSREILLGGLNGSA